MSRNNDAVIKELLQKVEEQKNGLGTRTKVAWVTNGIFKRDANSFFNLNTVVDVSVLANALGFLISQEGAFHEACKRLGVKSEYKWDGYTVEDWEEDFRTRISIIEYDKRKKTLDATRQKLNSLVSEETRTENELEEIKKLLS